MRLKIPEFCLVLMMGVEGSGKSAFASRHFTPTEVVDSHRFCAAVADRPDAPEAVEAALEVMELLVAKRLERRLLTVVDAPNLEIRHRRLFLNVARRLHTPVVGIMLDPPDPEEVQNWSARRRLKRQRALFKRSVKNLRSEGYDQLLDLSVAQKVELERRPSPTDKRALRGPFDIVGDLHGCAEELEELLGNLGYSAAGEHPEGRTLVFVGDLVDHGPGVLECYERVRRLVRAGRAYCLAGNHDLRLARVLRGQRVRADHGLQASLTALEEKSDDYRLEMAAFLEGLVSHLVLDQGQLVVTHAGLRQGHINRDSPRVREFCLYGDTRGEVDEFGVSARPDWVLEFRSEARVVYGHTPILVPDWCNRTLNIDTGAAFGGSLTALRYPELELASVSARQIYTEPKRGFETPGSRPPDRVRVDDLLREEGMATRFGVRVQLTAEERAQAFEDLHRCAVGPRDLIYLPAAPTPVAASSEGDLLERPEDALEDYAAQGVQRLLAQEKHGGARAVLLVRADGTGSCFGRAGRSLFETLESEREFVAHWAEQLSATGFWADFESEWLCLEGQLVPAAEVELDRLEQQRAALVSAGSLLLSKAEQLLSPSPLRTRLLRRAEEVERYQEGQREFRERAQCLSLAPLQLLATASQLYHQRPHLWHLGQLERYLGGSARFQKTRCQEVDLEDDATVARLKEWWQAMLKSGGRGLVLKPHQFLTRARVGWAYPALEIRAPEYLRLLHGPHYTSRLQSLRAARRGRLRESAMHQFLMGVEALEQLIEGEPLHQRHRLIFGILALENRVFN